MYHSDTIFWDYENCPVPKDASGYAIANNISSLARRFGTVKLFKLKAYLKISEQLPISRFLSLRSELQSCGVSVVDCPHNGRKEVADKMLLVDMLVYAIDNPVPSTVVLITGDRDFAYGLSILKLHLYYTVLVTLPGAHPTLTSQAMTCFDWVDSVVKQTDFIPTSRMRPSSHSPVDSLTLDTEERVEFASQTRTGSELSQNYSVARSKWEVHGVESTFIAPTSPSKKVVFPPTSWGASTSVRDSRPVNMFSGRMGSTLETGGERISEGLSDIGMSSDSLRNDLRGEQEISNSLPGTPLLAPPNTVPAHFPRASVDSSSSPAGSYATSAPRSPVIPEMFTDLVKVLRRHRSKGIPRSFQSVVESRMKKMGTYKKVGINSFSEYITLTENAGIVASGGANRKAWIRLVIHDALSGHTALGKRLVVHFPCRTYFLS